MEEIIEKFSKDIRTSTKFLIFDVYNEYIKTNGRLTPTEEIILWKFTKTIMSNLSNKK
jgi:hypothetical protein